MSNRKKLIPVKLDKNTTIYCREGDNIEFIKEKYKNRKQQGDYSYLMMYNEGRR
jgi:hypothetical protein